MIIRWVISNQIYVMQVDLKITYLLNELYRLTRIWLKTIYTQFKLVKNMLNSYRVDESFHHFYRYAMHLNPTSFFYLPFLLIPLPLLSPFCLFPNRRKRRVKVTDLGLPWKLRMKRMTTSLTFHTWVFFFFQNFN